MSFIQLLYTPLKATFTHKKHKATSFVTLLSGDKKISSLFFQILLKCLKRRCFISLVCILCFFLRVKLLHKKKNEKGMETPLIPSYIILLNLTASFFWIVFFLVLIVLSWYLYVVIQQLHFGKMGHLPLLDDWWKLRCRDFGELRKGPI